jgi:hypothetical protein
VTTNVGQPFALLRSLEARIDADALHLLAPVLRRNARLGHINLNISYGSARVLRNVAQWETLTAALVRLPANTSLSNRHILALQQLRQLRQLRVVGMRVRAQEFGDSEQATLLSRLGQLRQLMWDVDCAVSPTALRIIGSSCPLLRCLDMTAVFQLRALDDDGLAPYFPVLESLDTGTFEEIRRHLGLSAAADEDDDDEP